MFNKRKTSLLVLALLAYFAVPPLTVSLRTSDADALFAQTESATDAPVFTRLDPDDVDEEITVRIASSLSMQVVNQALKSSFEAYYEDRRATVSIDEDIVDTNSALQAVLDGSIDLAAIGRRVTEEEDAQGLKGVEINSEKIAIIVGPNNPFIQPTFPNDLTATQFVQIFRGEITNWKQLGGLDAPIRFIDRPENSDIRQSLSQYQVFEGAPFTASPNAIRVAEDDTAAIVRRLGRDGISYAIASQVIGQENVRVVPMHGILPDDVNYPFSQAWGYVYKEGSSPSVDAFLGFALDPAAGKEAVEEAKITEAAGVALADIPTGVAAVSPEREILATAGRDGYLQLRDFQGKPVGNPIKAHAGPITAISFSPDGQTIATSGADGVVKLWDSQGEQIGELSAGHKGPVTAVAFSPVDNQTLVSGGQDGTIHFLDLSQEEQSGKPIPAHEGGIRTLAFSPDGQLIATGGADQMVRLWNLRGDSVGPVMMGHTGPVTAIAFSPDSQASPDSEVSPDSQASPDPPLPAGPKLVSGSEDQTLILWSVSNDAMGQPIGQPFKGLEGPVTSVAFSPDGETIVSGSENAPLRKWNLKGESIGEPFADQSAKATNSISFGPDGKTLVSSRADGVPMFLNVSDGQPISQLPPDPDAQGENGFNTWVEDLSDQSPGKWGFGGVLAALLGYITWWLFGDREWKDKKLEEVRPSQKSIDVSQTTEDVTDTEEPPSPGEKADSPSSDFDESDFSDASAVDFSDVSAEDFATVSPGDSSDASSADSSMDSSKDSSEDFSDITSADFSNISSIDFDAAPTDDSAATAPEKAEEDTLPSPIEPETASISPALSSKLDQAKKALLDGIKLAKAGRYDESLDQLQLAIEAADVERVKASLSGASLVGATALLASGMARRGSILAKLNRTDEAIVSLDKAAELEPDSMTVLARKAKALKDSGRAQEAQVYLKKATKLKNEKTPDPVRVAEESLLPKRPPLSPNADAANSPSKGGDFKGQPPSAPTTRPAPLEDKQNQPQRGGEEFPVAPPPPPPKLPNNSQSNETGLVSEDGESEDIPASLQAEFESIPSDIDNLEEASLMEDASPSAPADIPENLPESEESRAPVDWPDAPELSEIDEPLESDSADIPPDIQAEFDNIPPNDPEAFS